MNTKTENQDVMDQAHVFDLAAESSKLSIRLSLLREVNNDMCHNWYWLANVRVVADHRVFRCRFVFWHDWDDVAEHFDADVLTKKKIRQYADEIAGTMFSLPCRFTRADWRKFVEFCNKTIEDYNR